MSIQYEDGHFGETLPADEAIDKLKEQLELNVVPRPKALHLGTERELEEIKHKSSIVERLDKLESKISCMEAEKRGVLKIPTLDEIASLEFPEKHK